MTAFIIVVAYMVFLLIVSFMARARQKRVEQEGLKQKASFWQAGAWDRFWSPLP